MGLARAEDRAMVGDVMWLSLRVRPCECEDEGRKLRPNCIRERNRAQLRRAVCNPAAPLSPQPARDPAAALNPNLALVHETTT